MIVATAAMPEIMPNATTLSTQFSGCSSASICAGSSSCTGVSWAIQIAEPDGREGADPAGRDPADRLGERGDRSVAPGLP